MRNQIECIVNHADVSEKAIERYLVEKVRNAGGICLKYVNAGATGFPDRLVLMPEGVTVWVELKSKGKKMTKIQAVRHTELKALGHDVHVADSKGKVDAIVAEAMERSTRKGGIG